MTLITPGIVAPIGLLVTTTAFTQMGMMGDKGRMRGHEMMAGRGPMNMSMARHRFVMRNGVPQAYAGKTNPLEPTEAHTARGKQRYKTHCASCHGASGHGDGDAGASLDPRPANIARFSKMRMASDEYLYWTIAEGGAPLGTAMPPFKAALDSDQIWEIILYLRTM